MDRQRWKRVDHIFEAALERAEADRPAFIALECAGDEQLRAEVQSLIDAHSPEDGFLEPPDRIDLMRRLAETEKNISPGCTLANYHIIRRLGRGSASEVYLAEDTRLGRLVAIKLLTRYWAADQDRILRFRREALAASALNHPNILTIYEVGTWQDRDFMAAEFVDGATLREYMRSEDRPVSGCIEIALQVANALAAAHKVGIVHRDIKPENIIVRPDGLVKVLDFGIAKYAGSQTVAAAAEPETATGLVIGTARYMSPEQARGQTVDARTDIWSLGVVLYEMVGKQLPFPGATASDCIAGILEREPEPLKKVRREIPARLENVVNRALAKDREARYGSATEFAEDLRTLRAGTGNEHRFGWRVEAQDLTRAWKAALLIGTIAAALISVWYFGPNFRPSRQTVRVENREMITSLAVLPFVNASGARETEYLSDGITDSLINDLSEIAQLKVMSRTAVFRYKGRNVDTRDVGKTLGVRAVLAGTVSERDNELSVGVELVDARDNSHLWGEHYKRAPAKLLDVQEDIAREITTNLRLRLSKDELGRLARRPTNNSEAYHLYLKGRFYWYKRAFPSWQPGSAPDFNKSRDYFQQAIEADPGYAPAYGFLGHYYAMAAGNGMMPPGDGWPKAEAAFKKALEIEPGFPDAIVGMAVVQWMNRRDWTGAERTLRAILWNSSASSQALLARLLAAEGRFEEAIALGRKGIEVDPLSIRFSAALGSIFYYARRYEESIRQYRQALELDPNDVYVHQALGDAYERHGLQLEAYGEWRTALTLAGDNALIATLERAHQRGGFTAFVRMQASTSLERFEKLTQGGQFVPAIEYARAYLRLGKKEQALRWLEKACDERNIFALYLRADPLYDELRSDARFQQLVKRIQIPE